MLQNLSKHSVLAFRARQSAAAADQVAGIALGETCAAFEVAA
jgi:hypothetical protein